MCIRGEASPFQPPSSSFRYFFINRTTLVETLDELIELAELTHEYTIDTESQSRRPPQQPDPALLQIEFVHPNSPSIVILMETLFLPPAHSDPFRKIRKLCRTIFSKNNVINAWGNAAKELKEFYRFDLFDRDKIDSVIARNVQDEFKIEFRRRYPDSPYVKRKHNETYSLQTAIFATFREFLDKRMTLGDWGCGLDFRLDTYRSSGEPSRYGDEQEIRRLMVAYAINDCLAVTKLVKSIRTWKPLTPPPSTVTDEEILAGDVRHMENNEEQVLELFPVDGDSLEYDVHGRDECQTTEPTEDDQPGEWLESNMSSAHIPEGVHGRDELPNDERRPADSKRKFVRNEQQRAEKRRATNRRKNLKRRIKRYDYEVIRKIYRHFTISDVKTILINMNIHYVNFNVIGRTLFLGVKNEVIRQRINEQLHEEMFSEEHYRRFRRRQTRRM